MYPVRAAQKAAEIKRRLYIQNKPKEPGFLQKVGMAVGAVGLAAGLAAWLTSGKGKNAKKKKQ